MMSECNRLQKRVCSSTKKVSWPTISFKLLAFIRSRERRGKPSGSSLLADKKDETGVMLRVGELAVEDGLWSFCAHLKEGGMDEDEDEEEGWSGEGLEMAAVVVLGRASVCETECSRSSVLLAMATMRFATLSNTSRIWTNAFGARRSLRPVMAMRA